MTTPDWNSWQRYKGTPMLDVLAIALTVSPATIPEGQWSTVTVEARAWAEEGDSVVRQVGMVVVGGTPVGFQVRIAGGNAGDIVPVSCESVYRFNRHPETLWWQTIRPEYPLGQFEVGEYHWIPNWYATPKLPGVVFMRGTARVYGRPGEVFRIEPIDALSLWSNGGQPTFWGPEQVTMDGCTLPVVGCYPDCDTTTGPGVLDLLDFLCFANRFAAGDPYADCDGSRTLDALDWLCYSRAFEAGCP